MDEEHLIQILERIEQTYLNSAKPPHIACLEALDELDLYIRFDVKQIGASQDRLANGRDALQRVTTFQTQLTNFIQAKVTELVNDIRSRRITAEMLKHYFNDWTTVSSLSKHDEPDFDILDEFLTHLFGVDYVPSETRERSAEMIYLQPTPGRIILEMINTVAFTENDTFFDLGSGLGQVALLVNLLTNCRATGIEYEPTYVHYAQCVAQKLGVEKVTFINEDVRHADLNTGTIFFTYTPFTGDLWQDVMVKLHDISRKQRITLCLYGPYSAQIEKEIWLVPIKWEKEKPYQLSIFRSI